MKTSNPASYDKIFATTSATVIPSHRGLLINCSAAATITITNLDGSTASVNFQTGNVLLPLQINKWTLGSGTITISAVV